MTKLYLSIEERIEEEKRAAKELKELKKKAKKAAFKEGFNQPYLQTLKEHPFTTLGCGLVVDATIGTALEATKIVLPAPVYIAVCAVDVATGMAVGKVANGLRYAKAVEMEIDNLIQKGA